MGLKTLKDLEFCRYFDRCVHPDLKCKEECYAPDIINDLKREAIKHIKKLQIGYKTTNFTGKLEYWNGAIDIMKHFFNITEEDLKNDKT